MPRPTINNEADAAKYLVKTMLKAQNGQITYNELHIATTAVNTLCAVWQNQIRKNEMALSLSLRKSVRCALNIMYPDNPLAQAKWEQEIFGKKKR